MSEPIACSLSADGAQRQLGEWDALRRDALRVVRIDGGVAMTFPATLDSVVRDLAAREAACCSFLDIGLEPGDDEITVTIVSPHPQAQPIVAALAGTGDAPRCE